MYSESKLAEIREGLVSIRNMETLPSESMVFGLIEMTINTLNCEDKKYRPHGKDKKSGGLLDFVGCNKDVVVVPDLHSRPDFLINLIDSSFGEKNVLSSLNDGSLLVVCLGDGVHTETEGYCRERWIKSHAHWLDGNSVSDEMTQEMLETFQTMMVVMTLKNCFPENFHFLKGNHENVLNQNGGGDHGFRKIVMEGQMVRDFLEEKYSQATSYLISEFEHSLPIAAIFDNFGLSHAEPKVSFKKKEVVDFHNHGEIIEALTWTENGGAVENSVIDFFHELNKKGDAESCFWIGGHRPVVDGNYLLRQDGHYIQIHNPNKMNVAWIHGDGSFDLEKDIIGVSNN